MSKIINRPHLVFWISIPLIILYGIINKNELLDVNVHDTYVVFRKMDLSILGSILFATIGFGYWMMLKTNTKLSKWLTSIHMTLTIGGILFILVLAQLFRESILAYSFNSNLTLAIYLITLIAIFGQLLFLINIIIGITNRLRN